MAKALLYTDLHIHSHKDSVKRLDDCLQVLKWVFDQAAQKKVDHVIFLGDLFHDRNKIDVMVYTKTFQVFKEAMSNNPSFDVHLLVGNHDMYLKETWEINSVAPLTAIQGVNIIDHPRTITFSGVDLDFCPHTENPIKELAGFDGRKKRRLLFGHMSVHGAGSTSCLGLKVT
jgi:DNA repair exonuclease SbcCD nuclease subunit